MVTRKPRDSRIAASEAAAMPLPREETTPPVTNTYLVMSGLARVWRAAAGNLNCSRNAGESLSLQWLSAAHQLRERLAVEQGRQAPANLGMVGVEPGNFLGGVHAMINATGVDGTLR